MSRLTVSIIFMISNVGPGWHLAGGHQLLLNAPGLGSVDGIILKTWSQKLKSLILKIQGYCRLFLGGRKWLINLFVSNNYYET